MFKQEFIDEAKALYPTWKALHEALENGRDIVGWYLNDNIPQGVSYAEILSASSLAELKEKAMVLKRKNDLYHAYVSGACYQTDETRREHLGCPRLYAQATMDQKALDAFQCYGVFHIPDCPKFKTGVCWDRFDTLGLKMKEG